jgi:hypothetical protein
MCGGGADLGRSAARAEHWHLHWEPRPGAAVDPAMGSSRKMKRMAEFPAMRNEANEVAV